jgi:N-acetylmuramoyl-L-alanine amidase
MTEEKRSRRPPFGERDDDEGVRPFGAPDEDRPTDLPEPPSPPLPEQEPRHPAMPGKRYDDRPRPMPAEPTPPPRRDDPAPPGPASEAILKGRYPPEPEPDEEAGPEPEPEPGQPDQPRGRRIALPGGKSTAGGGRAVFGGEQTIRLGIVLRSIGVVFGVAAVLASLFTWWTPNAFLSAESMDQLSVALATQSGFDIVLIPTGTATAIPTETPAPPLRRVGVVSGHRGIYPGTGLPDPGAVCEDGLTEAEVNEQIAERVVEWLNGHGYEVDLLDEFDPRLEGYQALAVVSIHADSCEYINDSATGFKVASFSESTAVEKDERLTRCLIDRYETTTGLPYHPSVTYDMTQYHNFREVAPGTPGAIIEVGFLYLDRDFLTENADVVALGVARGLLCYLRDEPVDGPEEVVEPAGTGEPIPSATVQP